MKIRTFSILLIVFMFAVNIADAKSVYKVKPGYALNRTRYNSSGVPAFTPKTPSQVANQQIMSSSEYKNFEQLSNGKPLFKNWTTLKAYNKINTVATRLMESSGIDQNIVFNVVSKRSANATTSLHDEIQVYTGLLKYVETEDELAAVLGHEIGHVINKDVRRKIRRSVAMDMLGLGGISTKADRNAEYKADIVSADLMVNAGYNPLAEISLLNKVVGHYSDGLKSHPTGRKRLMAIYTYIKNYYPDYIKDGYKTVSYYRALKVIGVD